MATTTFDLFKVDKNYYEIQAILANLQIYSLKLQGVLVQLEDYKPQCADEIFYHNVLQQRDYLQNSIVDALTISDLYYQPIVQEFWNRGYSKEITLSAVIAQLKPQEVELIHLDAWIVGADCTVPTNAIPRRQFHMQQVKQFLEAYPHLTWVYPRVD